MVLCFQLSNSKAFLNQCLLDIETLYSLKCHIHYVDPLESSLGLIAKSMTLLHPRLKTLWCYYASAIIHLREMQICFINES